MSEHTPRTVAVILAGGTGSRVGLSIPKQLLKIAGKSVLVHTLEVFQEADEIDDILLLMHPDHLEAAEQLVGPFEKVRRVVAGGQTRNQTTSLALEAVTEVAGADDTKVLFHDAVRPLVDHRIISDCVTALDTFDAVDVVIPSADTIVQVDDDEVIVDIPDRSHLRRGQTPQAFRLATIKSAYAKAWVDPDFTATDDCSVVLRYLPEVRTTAVHGSEQNMKITHPIDVFVADKLFQIASTAPPPSVEPQVYADLLEGKVFVVLGGSQGIGADIVSIATGSGAVVHSFSRSATGTDVANPEHVRSALASAHRESGRIDYVVVTAGLLRRGPLAEATPEDVAEIVGVNFLGPVSVAKESYPYLRESGGQLLLYTSSSYTRGRAGYALYSSTKAAVVNLTQALADEWSADGVRVNCINPERTATPMRTAAFGEESPDTLLTSAAVALTSIDVLLSSLTGHVIDVRRLEPHEGVRTRTEQEASIIASVLSEAERDVDQDDQV